MHQVWIDGAVIRDAAHLHSWLAQALSFPDWYGRNPDALADCLSEIGTPTELVVQHDAQLRETLGGDYEPLMQAMTCAAEDNPNISVSIRS